MQIVSAPAAIAFFCLSICGTAAGGELMGKDSACSALKKTIAKRASLPESGPHGMGWFCDFSTLSNKNWFVIELDSNRKCKGICSSLMGWYAVNRRSGKIHDYDIANLEIGPVIQ